MTDADLHELTKTRVDKEHLIEFAFQFLVDHEPISAIQNRFNIAVISTYFPEFPAAVKQWVAENTLVHKWHKYGWCEREYITAISILW